VICFIHTIKSSKTGKKQRRFLKYAHTLHKLSTSYPQNVDNLTLTIRKTDI